MHFFEDQPTSCGGPVEAIDGTVTISGPDQVEACDLTAEYHAVANGKDLDFSVNNDPTSPAKLQWVPSEEIELVSSAFANPVTVRGNTVGGKGELKLRFTECDERDTRTIASKMISISASPDPFDSYSTSVVSTVCFDGVNAGSGLLTVMDLNTNLPLTGVDDCIWSASDIGGLTLFPQPDKVTCQVTGVKGSFEITIQLQKNKCFSAPRTYQIDFPSCVTKPPLWD